MAQSRDSRLYLPRVIRRSEWLILTISDEDCDSCGDMAENHKWGLLDASGQKILYCNISAKSDL